MFAVLVVVSATSGRRSDNGYSELGCRCGGGVGDADWINGEPGNHKVKQRFVFSLTCKVKEYIVIYPKVV